MMDWLQQFWPDQPPLQNVYAGSFDCGEVGGFPCAVARIERQAGASLLILLAGLPPAEPVDGWNTSSGGLWTVRPAGFGSWEQVRTGLEAFVPRLRSAGAEPFFPLEELEHTEPLSREPAPPADPEADARLAAQRIECPSCGAPSAVAGLVGTGRCPFCSATLSLAEDLLVQLRRYRQRVQAAQRAVPHEHRAYFQAVPPLEATEVPLACTHCGAPNRHRPGALDETCAHCRAPLVPDASALARGFRNDRRRAAALRREVALRVVGRATGVSLQPIHLVLLMAAVLLFFIAPLIKLFADALGPLVWAAALVLGGVAAVGLGVVGLARRSEARRHTARWHRIYGALAEQLHASEIGGTATAVDWVRRWWNDRPARSWFDDSPLRAALPITVAGFPVLLTVSVEKSRWLWLKPVRYHADVVLAATLPRDTRYWITQGPAAQLVRDLEQAGFAVELRSGGVVLRAGGTALDRLRESPETTVSLAPVAFALARLAHLLRAEPPGAAPEPSSRGAGAARSQPG